MDLILKIIVGYFVVGVIALAILDLTTKRIRQNLRDSVEETKSRFASVGTFIGYRVALVMLIGALIIFWWAAIYGALTKPKGEKKSE